MGIPSNTCQLLAKQSPCAKDLAAAKPGITTDELDAIAHQAYIDEGGFPGTLNYHGYPNQFAPRSTVIFCGIPDSRPLEDGDILNVDVTMFLNGVHGDCSEAIAVGTITRKQAADRYKACMLAGIGAVRPSIYDIGEPLKRLPKSQATAW